MAAIPSAVVKRLKESVPRFQKILRTAQDRDVNEADTVLIITDMLADVFGFDKYSEVTREFAIKGTYVDLAVKINGKVEYLIEAKAIGTDLREHHLRQAIDYAAKEGVKWAVLTNGIDWEVHRVIVHGQVNNEKVASFSFLDLATKKASDIETLFLLCKRGISKDLMDTFYERQQACNKFVIGAILSTPTVTSAVRRFLKTMTPGLKVSDDEIADLIINDVIKREVQFGDSGVEAQKAVKRVITKQSRQKAKTKKVEQDEVVNDPPSQENPE